MDSRKGMIEKIKGVYSLDAPKVFSAMLKVPREEFVSREFRDSAYEDGPISIGYGQTISQPYTVAFMTDLLNLKGDEKVLEIGTGSGYQAAILSRLAKKVFTIERIPELASKAKKILHELGYKNIKVKMGQGEKGWEEEAPFDALILTAGVDEVSRILFQQIKEEGILVAPVGKGMDKKMTKFVKKKDGMLKKEYGVFHFVPLITGE